MKRLFVLSILILALFTITGANADERYLYIDRNVQKNFTSEDGLLSTSTQAVTQTRDGFIWIGGYGGLVRYDGKRFEAFAYRRITRVSDLIADEDGALWVATSDKGLFRYADNDFTSVSGDGEDAVKDVECMAFSPDGTLYLGTGSGLCAVKEEQVVRLDHPELNGEHIDKLLCPDGDTLLCVTRLGCLFMLRDGVVSQAEAEEGYLFRSLCYNAESDTFLVGTTGSEVLELDRDLHLLSATTMEGLSCINDLYRDANGALWLCADNGIAIYVDGSVRMQNLLMRNSVDRMMVDRERNYWFVSSRQGVLEVSRSQFGDVSQSAGLDSMVVNAIQRIGDTLYIGHDSGLVTISATDFKKGGDVPPDMLDGVRVRALLADSRGDLWIGTMKKGLFRHTPGGETVNFTAASYPEMLSDNIRCISETDEGILFGTDKGAYLVTEDGVKNVLSDPAALSFRILSTAKFGDTIYLGSDGNGFFLVRDGEIVRRITTEDGLSSNVIMKAYLSDAFGGIWLVTGNNIDYLDPDGAVTSIENFPTTNNLDLILMQNGDAWVFTGSGIYQTTEDSLLHDEDPMCLQFRHVDGLPYEVTPNAYQCMTDDVLYACGTGGVFSMDTNFSQSEEGDYLLAIDSVQADGQPIYIHPGEVCEIGSGVKRIDIQANVLTFQAGNPFVFYYLEGFDDNRTVERLTSAHDISYTNLNGGSYTFHYGVQDYRTGEVLREITLPIVKLQPWYRRPTVQLAAAGLGLLLVGALTLAVILIRSRRIKRSLQKEFEQKEKVHLQRIAYKDYLTGLYNRNYLDVWNARPPVDSDYPITYVSIDMNDLKKINDSYGHKNGDQLLSAMAELLKKHFADERYAVLRIGGDEFLVLARGADGEEVRATLERMREEGDGVRVNNIPVTFAYGLCTQTRSDFDFDEGLRVSDLEMLKAKDVIHGRV